MCSGQKENRTILIRLIVSYRIFFSVTFVFAEFCYDSIPFWILFKVLWSHCRDLRLDSDLFIASFPFMSVCSNFLVCATHLSSVRTRQEGEQMEATRTGEHRRRNKSEWP
jgi:hypothetical protein